MFQIIKRFYQFVNVYKYLKFMSSRNWTIIKLCSNNKIEQYCEQNKIHNNHSTHFHWMFPPIIFFFTFFMSLKNASIFTSWRLGTLWKCPKVNSRQELDTCCICPQDSFILSKAHWFSNQMKRPQKWLSANPPFWAESYRLSPPEQVCFFTQFIWVVAEMKVPHFHLGNRVTKLLFIGQWV